MDLSLSDTEEMLARSARDFVERSAGRDALLDLKSRSTSIVPEWTAVMRAAGWLGLLVPEACGGSGATGLEAALLYQELGRAPLPPAWLLSGGVCAPLLAASIATAERDAVLAEVANGTMIVAPALQARGRRWSGLTPLPAAPSFSAELAFVPAASGASHLLVAVISDEQRRFALVPTDHAAVTVRRLDGLMNDSHCVTITGLDLESCQQVMFDDDDRIKGAMAMAAAMIAAYQVGGCAKLLEMSVEYANTRVQFGRTIGSFQRVQDHIVRLVNALDSARWLTYEALSAYDSGRPFVAKSWLARAAAAEAHWECANAAHEVHAGVGSDPAFGLILHTSMSRLLHDVWGNPDWCRRQVAQTAGWLDDQVER